MKYFILGIIFIFFHELSAQNCEIKSEEYSEKLEDILEYSVDYISIEQLKKNHDDYLILDVRNKEEYDVSHIDKALWVGARGEYFKEEMLDGRDVLVYCSVGYRSEKFAEEINTKHEINAANLCGGIFEWINQNNSVFLNNTETKKIHSYNKKWSQWITNKTLEIVW